MLDDEDVVLSFRPAAEGGANRQNSCLGSIGCRIRRSSVCTISKHHEYRQIRCKDSSISLQTREHQSYAKSCAQAYQPPSSFGAAALHHRPIFMTLPCRFPRIHDAGTMHSSFQRRLLVHPASAISPRPAKPSTRDGTPDGLYGVRADHRPSFE